MTFPSKETCGFPHPDVHYDLILVKGSVNTITNI